MCDKINKEVSAPLNVSLCRSRGFALAPCPVPQHWHTSSLVGWGATFSLAGRRCQGWSPGLEHLRVPRCLRQLRSYLWEPAHTAGKGAEVFIHQPGLGLGQSVGVRARTALPCSASHPSGDSRQVPCSWLHHVSLHQQNLPTVSGASAAQLPRSSAEGELRSGGAAAVASHGGLHQQICSSEK